MRLLATALAFLMLGTIPAVAKDLAPTPPMGWNSWDAYGLTIDEADFRANARELSALKSLGWDFAVIDEGWYMENPFGTDLASRRYVLDKHGLLFPSTSRFPSAAKGDGFKPLADWVHAQGLKFGLHIVRGIPKQAVRENLPFAGTRFHAADAADTSDTCGWDDGDFGVSDTPAGQAYYDSMIRLYTHWGLDILKVDCIADHPYKASEIRQIAKAIKHSGRDIVLSLSPGPADLSHAKELGQFSQMWRISNDVWDAWAYENHGILDFPNGLVTAFDNLARWSPYVKPGNWPDADMLPWGSLTPHPGLGGPRQSGLAREEQRTQATLWAIARSPLILGGNLPKMDEFTRSLITNKDVIALNQKALGNHPVQNLPNGFDHMRVWVSNLGHDHHAVAIFNLADQDKTVHVRWSDFGLAAGEHRIKDLWSNQDLAGSAELDVALPAHGTRLFGVD